MLGWSEDELLAELSTDSDLPHDAKELEEQDGLRVSTFSMARPLCAVVYSSGRLPARTKLQNVGCAWSFDEDFVRCGSDTILPLLLRRSTIMTNLWLS